MRNGELNRARNLHVMLSIFKTGGTDSPRKYDVNISKYVLKSHHSSNVIVTKPFCKSNLPKTTFTGKFGEYSTPIAANFNPVGFRSKFLDPRMQGFVLQENMGLLFVSSSSATGSSLNRTIGLLTPSSGS